MAVRKLSGEEVTVSDRFASRGDSGLDGHLSSNAMEFRIGGLQSSAAVRIL
jgi:hypothetical protein